MALRPRKTPCSTCPYRRDVESGIWNEIDYDKLAAYDGETWAQTSYGVFHCHVAPSMLCAGWVGCHDMAECLAVRINYRKLDLDAVYDYVSPVPLFATGAEAAAHGKRDIENPSPAARRKIIAVIRMIGRRNLRS